MNLVLIGYRGTGKSTVGKILAERLKMPLVNLDDRIIAQAGMRIPEIVEKFGWDRFRDLESQVVVEVAKEDNHVLDCGGGVILREKNVAQLKKAGPVFWLQASIPTIVSRIKDDTQRPSLTGKSFTDEVADVLREREPKYRAAADHVVDTEGKSVEQVAEEIIRLFEK
ncbi:MAG: shikimate kinase [Deltaproteobacteria bacterium RBG_13_61_14]|nr:MAG: shikimate kinase [Deltaproteobacteria bacterium RBG_13_61_14]